MSPPDPRTEVAMECADRIAEAFIRNGTTRGECRQIARDALTTEAARVRGETWREAEQYANECEAVNTERGSILAWHKMAAHCRMQAKNLPTNQPTWSTARPTVAGWYWWRFDQHCTPSICHIMVCRDGSLAEMSNSGIGHMLLEAQFTGEWCPIARPGEREEW